jgi:hypothetical protein
VLFGALMVACNSQKDSAPAPDSPSSRAHETETASSNSSPAPASPDAASKDRADIVPLPSPIRRQDIVAVSILSPRSLSMKIRIKGGDIKVFKPMLKGDRRARYEVAAFLMARYLGVDGVPPAIMIRLPLFLLTDRLAKDDASSAKRLIENALVDDRQWVPGAQIDWVTDIDPDGIKKHGGLKTLKGWLHPARPLDIYEPMLAGPLSQTVAFDYLIGNWDRFSGGNLFINIAAERLVLLDHNGSFAGWGRKRQQRMSERLGNLMRFSKSFLRKLRALTKNDIEAALFADSSHRTTPLLTDEQISLMLTRRDELVKHVEAAIERFGKENTLVFE